MPWLKESAATTGAFVERHAPVGLQNYPGGGTARAATPDEVGCIVEIDLEVECDLCRVLLVVASAKQLLEAPTPHPIKLVLGNDLEGLQLSRSHLFPS